MKLITRNVWILSIVSLLNDVASEMLYPVMPIYLESIGYSIVFIGVLEGCAEAVAGLSKGYFGRMSDLSGKRLPFVRLGYGFSAFAKPMMAVFTFPVWIFGVRTLDKVGKGLRTGARDAMLSDEATPETKGRVFGFHRAMDTVGAVIGPLGALLYLHFYPDKFRTLFLITFIPGVLTITCLYLIREKQHKASGPAKPRFLDFLRFWKESPAQYRRLTMVLLLFALINSSDVFLLLWAKASGLSASGVILLYVFYNLVYALFSFPAGILADKWGPKRVIVSGLLLFAITYTGMALAQGVWTFVALFTIYGIYAAGTEGISKAWISGLCKKEDTATAIGTYTAFQSLCALAASSIAGLVWYNAGAQTLFIGTGSLTVLVAILMLLFTQTRLKTV